MTLDIIFIVVQILYILLVLPIVPVANKSAVGNFKKKMDGINPLSKFLSPLISYICGEDTVSVPGIICGTIWGSFLVLGSFAIQFGDHLRVGIICGPLQAVPKTQSAKCGERRVKNSLKWTVHIAVISFRQNGPVFNSFQTQLKLSSTQLKPKP